jgi:pyruvate/2-oxoglutarate dehydrogenase complex dihydrolipoamide acyltransferase (E2) component
MPKIIEIRVPKVGMDTTEVVVTKWLVKCGDWVKKGVPLLELESEKTTLVLESEGEGTIIKICQPEGSAVPVGELVCLVQEAQPGEEDDG